MLIHGENLDLRELEEATKKILAEEEKNFENQKDYIYESMPNENENMIDRTPLMGEITTEIPTVALDGSETMIDGTPLMGEITTEIPTVALDGSETMIDGTPLMGEITTEIPTVALDGSETMKDGTPLMGEITTEIPTVTLDGSETMIDGTPLMGEIATEIPTIQEEPQYIVRPGSVDGNTLAGDVMIDFPDGSSIPGIIAPRGLAGSIVFPGMLGDPEVPIEFPDFPDVPPLAGSVVLSPNFDSALDVIADLLEKYRNEKVREIVDLDKLLNFIESTKGQFRWNDEYIKDSTVTPVEKMDGAKDVAVSNLTTIRDAAKKFQNELSETEEKGMKM